MKCKQSQKIESNIRKLKEKDAVAACDSASSKESGITNPTNPTT